MTVAGPARGSSSLRRAVRRLRAARARRRRRRLLAGWLALCLVGGLVSFTSGMLFAPTDFAVPPPPRSALLLDVHGAVFATIRSPEVEEDVPTADIPTVLQHAVVAAEDERFYQNPGVDLLSTLRAALHDLAGGSSEGGSTITQQYVKNVYVGNQHTLLRKLREAVLAFRLDHKLSKTEILTRYLNVLYLGNGTYGVQAASRFYFGVPVQDLALDPVTHRRSVTLALARAALLAGIAPAPSLWNPLANPRAARARQLYTLNRMVAAGMISAGQASAAYGAGLPALVGRSDPGFPTIAPEFRDLVTEALLDQYGPDWLYRGGLRVNTTLDLLLQEAAVTAIHQVLPSPDDPEAAVVAIDPRNGDIRALAEKKDGGYHTGGFDLATDASRSSGSTIKPFTLAVALEEGMHTDQTVYAPSVAYLPDPGGVPNPYPIHNDEPDAAGYYTLRTAMEQSVNTVYGPLAVRVGLRRVFTLAQAAGLHSGPGVDDFARLTPAKSIGVDVTPESEAVAYATLMDHGLHHQPRTIVAVNSAVPGLSYTAPADPPGNRVMPAAVADQVIDVLRGVVQYGTGTAAAQPFPVYGKTGTTDNYLDAWFTGCTPQLCIAVWMGYDHEYLNATTPHSMVNVEGVPQVYGGTLPAEIFARVWQDYRALDRPAGRPVPRPTATSPVTGPTAAPVAPPAPVPGPATPVVPTGPVRPRRTPSPTASRPRPTPSQPSPSPSPPSPSPPPTPTGSPLPR